MPKLALIRHGHTLWNRAGRLQGRTDIPLAPDVMEEMSRYRLPPEWQEAEVVSSPLSRATQTAELICGRTPQTENALLEMDWGDWEGQRSIDLGADPQSGFLHVEQWGWNFRPPNGESPGEVLARLQPWLQGLRFDTVAVCHIGVMRTLLAVAHGWEFAGPMPFEIKRKRLYILILNESVKLAHPSCLRLVSTKDGAG